MKLIPLFALFLSALSLSAQITSGSINYNESYTIELGDWMDAERKKEMEKQIAEGDFDRTGRLIFDNQSFSYSQLPKEGATGWMARRQENPDVFYTNMQDSMVTDRRNVMDRAFIMEDEWVVPEWNIAKMKVGMKEIPLPNQLASAVSVEGDTLLAYFTPSIPLSIGPRGYGGLPGAIVYLKVTKDGRSTEYTMTTMQPNLPDGELKKPTEGKIIDREEFEEQMARAMEIMERRRRSWKRRRG